MGEEYAKLIVKRGGEKTSRDVRRRLMRDGHDGVCIEYDGGVVDYIAFSNRSIKHVSDNVCYTIFEPARIKILKRLSALNRQRWEEEEAAGMHKKGKK